MKPTTVDFETFGIDKRPDYPPVPVGVAIDNRYYAWGHPTGNNCTKGEAVAALKRVWKLNLLFHNAKFDIDVAETHMGMPRLDWQEYHDTVFLLFLQDPHAQHLGLKESAERLLGWVPDERDAVADWLIDHQPVTGVKISRAKSSDHYWGRYIAYAPGGLVGEYAIGDTHRTAALFEHTYDYIVERGMSEAYDRERELMPILLDNEKQGIHVNVERLGSDVSTYKNVLRKVEGWIAMRLNLGLSANLNSAAQMRDAMIASGVIDIKLLGVTPTGKLKSDKKSLGAAIVDHHVSAMLNYRASLKTCLNFMESWLETASRTGGLIHTAWNQTRNDNGGGARTGRLSSTPNFQNVPNPFKELKLPIKLPALPSVRSYIVPWSKGHALIDRDYSQQELRILAHYEDGSLKEQYLKEPWMDAHSVAQGTVNNLLGTSYARKPIKNTVFGLIYGMGVGLMAQNSGIPIEDARAVKTAVLSAFPGVQDIMDELKRRAFNNQPLRTWGGREYYCEPPRIVKGQMREFSYKMLNVLIQGSAADCTKQAIINYANALPKGHKFYMTVHDEILSSVPKAQKVKGQKVMRAAMEQVQFDVPMLSEGTFSETNCAEMKDYDKKGERCP